MKRVKIKSRIGLNQLKVVMKEYEKGRLRDPWGNPVKSRKQAMAIALREARAAEKGGVASRTFKGRRRLRPRLRRK